MKISVANSGDVSLCVPRRYEYDGGALGPSRLDRPFHGLWSLWEIMNLFDVALFIRCISNIDRNYPDFVKIRVGKWSSSKVISVEDRDKFDKVYEIFERACLSLEIVASVASLKKMRECLKSRESTYGDFFGFGVEFSERFKDEMENRHVYALSLKEAAIVRSPTGGWEDAVNQFPTAAYDIAEASLCLAFQRSTSSAFHSIRCLEAAIRALARCLGIADPTKAAGRNWGAVLKTVKDELDRRWPTSTDRLSGDGEFFDSAYAALAAMQNPWRNATMHLDQKYTEDEAAHLHEVIKGFMRKIASRCDENGDPKA
jgi:hypothetical protein